MFIHGNESETFEQNYINYKQILVTLRLGLLCKSKQHFSHGSNLPHTPRALSVRIK